VISRERRQKMGKQLEEQIHDAICFVIDPKDHTSMVGLVAAMGPRYMSEDGSPTTDARTELHIVLPGVKWDVVKKQPIWPPPGSEV
jgi:hypothetical protein